MAKTRIKISEKDVQKTMIEWLKYQPSTFCWRQNSGSMYADYKTGRHGFKTASVDGIADIMGIWRGKPFALEVKREGGELTRHQWDFLHKFMEAGGIALVATSIDELQSFLNEIASNTMVDGAGVFTLSTKVKIKGV